MSVIAPPSPEYLDLINEFPLRPIHTDEELAVATQTLHKLLDRSGKLSDDEEGYLNILGDVIRTYETTRYPVRRTSRAKFTLAIIDSRGLSMDDVARGSGIDTATLGAILAGTQPFTADCVAGVAGYLGIDPVLFGERDSDSWA